MSCNGCRVLRKGCSQTCILRPCLRWIGSPDSQGYATLFLAKFFGRSDLLSFISAVPENQRPALFQSLIFETCGRTVNPVSGAVGLLSSGNWHVCHAAVQTVLSGGVLRPLAAVTTTYLDDSDEAVVSLKPNLAAAEIRDRGREWSCGVDRRRDTVSFSYSEDSDMTTGGGGDLNVDHKLLNLFV